MITPIEVTLTEDEFRKAVWVGCKRRMYAIKHGLEGMYGADNTNAWTYDIEGSNAEMTTSVFTGIHWEALTVPGDTDVGPLGVRSTVLFDNRMILHDRDRSDKIFVFVTGNAPKMLVMGWAWGFEGKKAEYLWKPEGVSEKRKAYFTPHRILRDPSTLLKTDVVRNALVEQNARESRTQPEDLGNAQGRQDLLVNSHGVRFSRRTRTSNLLPHRTSKAMGTQETR